MITHALDLSLPVEDHLVWDGWAEATGAAVDWPNIVVKAADQNAEVDGWRCLLDDDDLVAYVGRLREVVKQPLVGEYAAAADSLLAFLEQVGKHRVRLMRMAKKS